MPTPKKPAKKVAARTRKGATIDVKSTVRTKADRPARVTKAPATVSKYTEIGASGLQITGGRVNEEFDPLLRGERGIRMWREMGDNDAYSGAMLYGILQTILRAEWTVDQNESTEAEAQFLEECKDDMEHPFRDVIAEAMTCPQYGWALLEVIMKQRSGPDAAEPSDFTDGRFGWHSMPLRAQETLYQWIVDPSTGRIVGMRQRLWGSELTVTSENTVDIPLAKCVHFRTTHHKDNPEGRSMLRSGWKSYDKRKKVEVHEGIGIERDLAGIPVFKVPAELMGPHATPDQKAALAEFHRIGKNLRMDDQSHLVIPNEYDEHGNPLYEFELASTMSRRSIDINQTIVRLAIAQLMSVMADVMMVGHESTGSRALASTKEQMFTSGCQSLLDEVRNELNDNAVARLFRVNGIAPPWPKFTTSPIERTDPAEFVANVLALAQSGMPLWPDDDLDGYIRDFLGWPAMSEMQHGMQIAPPVTTDPVPPKEKPVTAKPAAGKKTGGAADPKKQADSQGQTTPRRKRPVKVGD